ncbi:MAG: NAD(P)-binding domain-containing protein [Proteobacteria bacterium]|nr:NAD(P)-binding domain-containing protein [Pseudomonadota bacterium]NIS71044.1 NAD(P)-binding domain-containing protein [Pseudomonadota bacterium]
MRIAVIGGAGAMVRAIIQDLSENPRAEEILVADCQEEKAKARARAFKDPRIKGSYVDAHEIDETANLVKAYDAVINAAQYDVNIEVMEACLRASAHYNDLGGMFHTTRQQLNFFGKFKGTGLKAVLGVGGAPGITNVLARYGYDQLSTVEIVRLSDASIDMTEMKGIDAFVPPYSGRTIMEEYSDESVEFIDGEYKTLPPLSGAMEIDFPEPIGRRTCVHTLHSEPATIPASFQDKGVREVTWRLSLPHEFETKAQFLASLGFAGKEPIAAKGVKVTPLEVLAVLVDRQIKDKFKGVKLRINDMECLRAQVIGKKRGREVEYTVDCIVKTHSRWGLSCGDVSTGVPPSIVAQMQTGGMIPPGVWGPEQVIDPEYFFKEVGKRGMEVQATIKEHLT